jgi:hypothetical protein
MSNGGKLSDLLEKVDQIITNYPLERIFQVMSLVCENKSEGQFPEAWKRASEACMNARDEILCLPKPVGRGQNAEDSKPF